MIDFNLYIPTELRNIQLLPELEMTVNIEDLLESRDNYSLFFSSSHFLCDQITHIPGSIFKIEGYGLQWHGYIYLLNDILPEIIGCLKSVEKGNPFSIMFCEFGSLRILNFINDLDKIYESYCTDMLTDEKIGDKENIEKKVLYNYFIEIIKVFSSFVKKSYPKIFDYYVKPYLDEHMV